MATVYWIRDRHIMPRNHKQTSNEDRARIIETYLQGEDFVAVAQAMGIKRTTAYGVIRNYQLTNRMDATHAGGRPKITDNEKLDFIILLFEANPLLTLKQVKEEFRQVWPNKPDFSTATLATPFLNCF